jgi:hypothetical protein
MKLLLVVALSAVLCLAQGLRFFFFFFFFFFFLGSLFVCFALWFAASRRTRRHVGGENGFFEKRKGVL